MTIQTTINTAANALGITRLAAARIAKDYGHDALRNALDALADTLAGQKMVMGKLPPVLIDALDKAVGGGKHASAAVTSRSGGGFSTRNPPTTVGGRNQPPLPEEEVDEFMCPTSSNLYSFSFVRRAGETTGDLYVTFRAVNLNSAGLSRGKVKKGKGESLDQLVGARGSTVKGGLRPFSPGARYRYYRVPISVYKSLKNAHSKGEELWSKVRIRGTIAGHRFQYTLASPDVQVGHQAVYIPRKAVAGAGGEGTVFRTRSLPVAGSGGRSFLTSTISGGISAPSSGGGFSTRPAPGKRGR